MNFLKGRYEVYPNQRFGDWEVVHNDYRYDRRWNRRVLCRDVVCDKESWVLIYRLIHGKSKRHRSRNSGPKTKYLGLPKGISRYPYNGYRQYRVIKKINNKVKTLGYYRTLEEAVDKLDELKLEQNLSAK